MNDDALPTPSHWTCPVCQAPLLHQARQYRCENGHCFDQAKEGYLNLLPVHRKRSANPGDDRKMLLSRREFLDRGHYRPLADRIAALCAGQVHDEPVALLDTGCGEGYYTAILAAALPGSGHWVGGIDIAKDAVRMAAKRYQGIDFAVASTAALPVADASLDIVTRVFAPGSDSELVRTLRPGGLFVEVSPAPRHLFALRALVYDQPREHDDRIGNIAGLQHQARIRLDFPLHIDGEGDAGRLLSMTPYYWQASAEKQARIAALTELDTEASFNIDCYRRPAG